MCTLLLMLLCYQCATMCECNVGENRMEKLEPVPLPNDTLAAEHTIFMVPIVIVAGNI